MSDRITLQEVLAVFERFRRDVQFEKADRDGEFAKGVWLRDVDEETNTRLILDTEVDGVHIEGIVTYYFFEVQSGDPMRIYAGLKIDGKLIFQSKVKDAEMSLFREFIRTVDNPKRDELRQRLLDEKEQAKKDQVANFKEAEEKFRKMMR